MPIDLPEKLDHPSGAFSISYPQTWTVKTSPGAVHLGNGEAPFGSLTFSVAVVVGDDAPDPYGPELEGEHQRTVKGPDGTELYIRSWLLRSPAAVVFLSYFVTEADASEEGEVIEAMVDSIDLAQEPLDPPEEPLGVDEDFLAAAFARCRERLPGHFINVVPGGLLVDNMTYADLTKLDAARGEGDEEAQIESFVDGLERVLRMTYDPPSLDDARESLFPVLRTKDYVSAHDVIFRPWVADLVIAYAVDLNGLGFFITDHLLSESEIPDESDLYELAMENLTREKGIDEGSLVKDKTTGLVVFAERDPYNSSRVLLPAFPRAARDLVGDFHLGIPGREDVLLFSVADVPEGQARAAIRELYGKAQYPVTTRLLRHREGDYEVVAARRDRTKTDRQLIYPELMTARDAGRQGLVFRPFAGDLVVAYRVGRGGGGGVTHEQVAALDLDTLALDELALRNLARDMALSEDDLFLDEDVVQFAKEDRWNASRVLLPEFSDAVVELLGEGFLLGVPTPQMIIAYPRDIDTTEALDEVGTFHGEGKERLSRTLFRWDEDRFEVGRKPSLLKRLLGR